MNNDIKEIKKAAKAIAKAAKQAAKEEVKAAKQAAKEAKKAAKEEAKKQKELAKMDPLEREFHETPEYKALFAEDVSREDAEKVISSIFERREVLKDRHKRTKEAFMSLNEKRSEFFTNDKKADDNIIDVEGRDITEQKMFRKKR